VFGDSQKESTLMVMEIKCSPRRTLSHEFVSDLFLLNVTQKSTYVRLIL